MLKEPAGSLIVSGAGFVKRPDNCRDTGGRGDYSATNIVPVLGKTG